MSSFDSLFRLKGFSGVYPIGNVPYESGMYIVYIKQHGYVAVHVNGNETEVFDPKGRLHPSIKEYLKMCNIHHAKFNNRFYQDKNNSHIRDYVKSRLSLVWEPVN